MQRQLLLVLAILLPPLGAWMYFFLLAGSAWSQPVYTAVKVVMIIIAIVGWRAFGTGAMKRSFAFSRRSLALGVLYGLIIAAILLGLFSLFSSALAPFASSVQSGAATLIPAAYYLPVAIVFSLAHSLLEEWYWRGYVGASLVEIVPHRGAILTAALAFTLHHIIILWQLFPGWWAVLMSFGVFVAGAFWMWLFRRTSSLVAPWISHAFADLAIFAIGFAFLTRF